jgi:hypothetical protein
MKYRIINKGRKVQYRKSGYRECKNIKRESCIKNFSERISYLPDGNKLYKKDRVTIGKLKTHELECFKHYFIKHDQLITQRISEFKNCTFEN